MNSNFSFDKLNFLKNASIPNFCSYHNEIYESYCKSCSQNICKNCKKSHFNHDLIFFKEIQPKKEEIELLKKAIKKYEEVFNEFLSEIFSWKKLLDKMIISFQNQIKENQRINNNKLMNYINNNNNKNLKESFHDINNMGLFEYNNYNKIKLYLAQIKNNQNNPNNNFLFNSHHIIEILWENYLANKKNNESFDNNSLTYKNKNKKIIEKYIDFSLYKKTDKTKNIFDINKRNENQNINLNKTQPSFRPKTGNIFLDQIYLKHLNNSNYNIHSIYYKKRSYSNNKISWKDKKMKNISFNVNEFNTNFNINKLNLILKNEKMPNLKKNITFNKYTPEIKVQNKNKNNRTFIHKKFEPINLKKFIKNNIEPKTPKYSSKSKKNILNEINCYLNSTSGNKFNSTYNDSENIKQQINFDLSSNETNKNTDITLLLNNELDQEGASNKIKYNNSINNNNINDIIIPKIINTFKYSLNQNQPLYIGLEIGNLYCKIGIINQNQDDKNIFSFPFMISFNEEKNEIKIGQESFNYLFNNSSKNTTIFDLMKFFGKNSDEIMYKKEIYPYKIYSKENRPCIKINFNNKEKIFNFEDLFTIYMEKIFEKFFTKIDFVDNNNNNKTLKINLSISIPDNLSYFQRKIIEKIFQTQIFPSFIANKNLKKSNNNNYKKKLYNGYQIILKDIKIANESSLIHLCYKSNNNEDKINKNILAIIEDGENIHISLSRYYKDKINNELKDIYEIKNVIDINKGSINFISDFIEQRIKKEKEKENNIINDDYIYKLRKIYYEFILDINEDDYHNEDLNEFLESMNDIYIEIISSIKTLIQKEKLNLNNINNIILNGKILKTKSFINLLSLLFKDNKEIQLQLTQISSYNNNIINGTLKYSFSYCILKNISPISFGVDSFGKMEFIIKKGNKIPLFKNKLIKIKNIEEKKYLQIKVYEGENKEINKNRIISCINISKKNFKNEKICYDYIELLLQFELDEYYNLKVFVLDPKTTKKRFECLININIIKG